MTTKHQKGEVEALRAECAALRSALEELRDWASRIAHDERVCGWLHAQDYSLYCLLADCPVDFAAILDGKTAEEAER